MEDYLIKAFCYKGSIRAYAISATKTVSEAQKRYDTWSSSTAALGRILTGALLLGVTLRGDDKLTVKMQGDGSADAIIVDSNGHGETKDYIRNPHISLESNVTGKIDMHGAVGNEGIFTVIKGLGLRETFSGQTPIVSGEISEDFIYFMMVSEQVPSAIDLDVLVDADESVKAAGSFMIRAVPGADESTINFIKQRLVEVPPISQLLENRETPEQILYHLLREGEVGILEKMPVQFKCDCSEGEFATALIAVGIDELGTITDEGHGAETVCQFCNSKYHYSEEELIELHDEAIRNTKQK